MSYAIVRLGGKQFKIQEGDTFVVERQQSPVNFEVLAYFDGEKLTLGTPTLSDVNIDIKLVSDTKGDKIRVGRFKSKSRYRKTKGHRQPQSVLSVEQVGNAKKEAPVKKVTKKVKVEEKAVEAEK